jgi:hypothetical protein
VADPRPTSPRGRVPAPSPSLPASKATHYPHRHSIGPTAARRSSANELSPTSPPTRYARWCRCPSICLPSAGSPPRANTPPLIHRHAIPPECLPRSEATLLLTHFRHLRPLLTPHSEAKIAHLSQRATPAQFVIASTLCLSPHSLLPALRLPLEKREPRTATALH